MTAPRQPATHDGRRAVAVRLRRVQPADLELFFEQLRDPVAVSMAAFTPPDPDDRVAFSARWRGLLADETVVARTILADGEVAGHIARFERAGRPEVTYWIARELWGRGIATAALSALLTVARERPLFARAAADNVASIRVLEKCGFVARGRESGHAAGRGRVVDEVVLALPARPETG